MKRNNEIKFVFSLLCPGTIYVIREIYKRMEESDDKRLFEVINFYSLRFRKMDGLKQRLDVEAIALNI